MKMTDTLKAACLLALTVAFTSSPAATNKELDQALSRGGLQKIEVEGLDLAYARPGASLAAYKRVQLEPVQVEFRKSKDPARPAARSSSAARSARRSGPTWPASSTKVRQLQKSQRLPGREQPGPDVLRVKPKVLDLYVNAPDVGPGRSRTLVSSAGEIALVADLADSTSGQVLARVADQRDASKGGRIYLVNGKVNEEEARKIAGGWAQILRKALDKAHGIGS